MYPDGGINLQRIERLAFVLSDLQNRGKEIILVSSGAIGVGMDLLQLPERPTTIPKQQAVAAVGQSQLMNLYSKFFLSYGQVIGQILMTRDIVEFPESRLNASNTFEQLLQSGVIPIVNENDSVSVEELDHLTKFGDNDQLSAIVAEITNADLLIMLTDVAGFYNKNPNTHQDAVLFTEISEISDSHYQQSGGQGSRFGTGGMITKLKAAEHLLKLQGQMVLTNGKVPDTIFDIVVGKEIGTLFTPKD
ncbi:glutamate 5-kinase [Desemzia sp. RIT804]|nr:glutamate 5-kinase [Desemzia sp. RIT 804]